MQKLKYMGKTIARSYP